MGVPGQDAATFIVSNVDELRTAVLNLPSAGGKIVVRAGTYILTASIVVNRDNVEIEGEGAATFFMLGDGVNCPCFVIGEPTPFQPSMTHRNVTLRNFRVSGNRQAQTSELCGIPGREHLRNNCVTLRQVRDCTVENVILEGARSGGIVLELACSNILLRRVTSSDNHFDGIAWDGDITDSFITESTARENLASGLSFDIGPKGNIIADSFFVDNGSVGLFIRDSQRNLFANCYIGRNTEDGVFIADGELPGAAATENIFDANFYVDNGRFGIWQAGENSVHNVVDGGLFQGNAANAIEESFPVAAPLIQYNVTIIP